MVKEQDTLIFFDIITTELGDMLVAFKNDYSLIAIFLPANNSSDSIKYLKLLIEKKGLPEPIEKEYYLYRNVFIDYFKGKEVPLSKLKYDINFFNPTNFQKDVWKTCKEIPYSSTKTYRDIALELDKKCFRSVGVALGKNNLPILIPCHRVVSKNGIGGFSGNGGISMKKKLLALENPNFPKTI